MCGELVVRTTTKMMTMMMKMKNKCPLCVGHCNPIALKLTRER